MMHYGPTRWFLFAYIFTKFEKIIFINVNVKSPNICVFLFEVIWIGVLVNEFPTEARLIPSTCSNLQGNFCQNKVRIILSLRASCILHSQNLKYMNTIEYLAEKSALWSTASVSHFIPKINDSVMKWKWTYLHTQPSS